MLTWAIGYGVALVIFFGVDMAWLATMAPRFYRPTMGDIALETVNLPAAIAFYALYPIGLLVFAVAPALRAESIGTALAYGAMFGFFTYMTYDLTNWATLRNWTLALTLVDVAWGTLLAGITAAVTFVVVSRIAGS